MQGTRLTFKQPMFNALSLLLLLALGATSAFAQVLSTAQLQVGVRNCGTCGRDRNTGTLHSNQTCTTGQCGFAGCQAGYYYLNNDQLCEYACTLTSSQEACNGPPDLCRKAGNGDYRCE
jgi:hypothetical protein